MPLKRSTRSVNTKRGQSQAIEHYLNSHSDEPKPLIWATTADNILEKVARGRVTLSPKLRHTTRSWPPASAIRYSG